jgi:hypothetical protein
VAVESGAREGTGGMRARAAAAAVKPGNLTHGHARPRAPDPNGQGMGRNLHPWVSPMGDPISHG